jgi:hypothetical protein
MQQLATKIRHARASLSDRRTMRLAHRRLSHELAAFTSGSDRAELDDILDRYPTAESEPIRAILRRQDAERLAAEAVSGRRR